MTKTMRARTGDRGPPGSEPQALTVEQIGPNMARTPNGNLICYNVPIARTGMLLYRAGEVPLRDKGGVIRVHRSPESLFNPKTIGSFMGVAITEEHPNEMEVTPKTWKRYAYGFCIRCWRGEGEDSDVLLADLMVTDKYLIEQILAGKREVSAGYDAEYVQTIEGEGNQIDIIGNHIALVERGRCGPRCAIGDHDSSTNPKGKDMTIRKRLTSQERAQAVRQLIGDAADLLEDSSDPPGDGGSRMGNESMQQGGAIHIHVGGSGTPSDMGAGAMPPTTTVDQNVPAGGDPAAAGGNVEARLGALESAIKQILSMMQGGGAAPTPDAAPDEEAPPMEPQEEPTRDAEPDAEEDDDFPPKTNDELPVKQNITAQKTGGALTGDSAAFTRSYEQLLADVEILVPGMKVPTFDSKATRTKTVDRMCSIRRRALHGFAGTAHGATVLGANADAATLDDMDCAALAGVFKTSAAAMRVINNHAATGDSQKLPTPESQFKPNKMTVAELNKANADFYARSVAKV